MINAKAQAKADAAERRDRRGASNARAIIQTPGAVVDLVVVVLALLGFHAPALCTCAVALAA
jgi:hypothetical protein